MNEKLQIIISANVAQAQSALKSVQTEVDKTAKGSSKLSKIGEAVGAGMKKAAQVTAAATAACAAGIAALTKSAVSNFADYEQLVGGVDTLFKDSSAKVQQYAKDAFKNTGMSANEYMETVTGFSASLLQSLGGDTEAAADIGNMAVMDMADNANKMGTSMESIQNAYQGFAKGNYTMLDNLKLGYGGTKEEMQRLLADAEKISGIHYDISNLSDVYSAIHVIQQEMQITGTTAEEAKKTISGSASMMKAAWTNLLTGIAQNNGNLDELISNFVDSVKTFAGNLVPVIQTVLKNIPPLLIDLGGELLSVIQKILDAIPTRLPFLLLKLESGIQKMLPSLVSVITGIVTQLISVIIALFPLVVEGITEATLQIISAITELIPSIVEGIMQIIPQLTQTLMDNVPVFLESLMGVITILIEGIGELFPVIVEAVTQIIPMIIETFYTAIPQILEAAVQLLMVIVDAIPLFIPALVEALPSIYTTIIESMINSINVILDGAVQLFTALVDAIPLILPVLIDTFPIIIDSIVSAITENIPTILNSAINLFTAIINAIPKILPKLVAAIPQIISAIVSTLARNIPKIASTALQLFLEIVKAIPKIAGQLLSALGNLMSQALNKIGSFAVSIGQAVGDGISGAVKAAINGVLKTAIGIINGFIGAINGAIGVINAIPGVSISKLDKLDVPQFAKGGIVDSATLAVVGEAGKEAVVPLENNTEWIDELAKKIKGGPGGDNPPPVVLQVDGKTFAQTAIGTINDLTKQTGRLDLVLA